MARNGSLSGPVALAGLLAAFSASGCGGGADASGRPELVVYTSIYKEVLPLLRAALERELPDVQVKWVSFGSEEIAARLGAQLAAGRTDADLLLTSDPFWYSELKAKGHLLPYESPAAAGLPTQWRDPDGAFSMVRFPVMVMVRNTRLVSEADAPKSFHDLRDERFTGKITMGDPTRSGSSFTTVVRLVKRYGWEYFEDLRRRDVLSAGGNSAVLNRVLTGEYALGIVLLENVLRALADGDSEIAAVFPVDGAVAIPSPMAILASTDQADQARRFYDFMLSEAGQAAVVSGFMYSPFAEVAGPSGAPPMSELVKDAATWTPEFLRETAAQRNDIKERFSRIMHE